MNQLNFILTLLNLAIDEYKRIKAEVGMTDAQLSAYADSLDLQNLADIKSLLGTTDAPTTPQQ